MDNNSPIIIIGAFFLMVLFISSALKKDERNDAVRDAINETVRLLVGLAIAAVVVGFLLLSGKIAR